jgi:hypothetical protein
MGAMEAHLNKNMKTAKMKERMQAKAQANAQANASKNMSTSSEAAASPTISEEEIIKIFSTGEKVEKTPRGAKPPANEVVNSKTASDVATNSTAAKKGKKKK